MSAARVLCIGWGGGERRSCAHVPRLRDVHVESEVAPVRVYAAAGDSMAVPNGKVTAARGCCFHSNRNAGAEWRGGWRRRRASAQLQFSGEGSAS